MLRWQGGCLMSWQLSWMPARQPPLPPRRQQRPRPRQRAGWGRRRRPQRWQWEVWWLWRVGRGCASSPSRRRGLHMGSRPMAWRQVSRPCCHCHCLPHWLLMAFQSSPQGWLLPAIATRERVKPVTCIPSPPSNTCAREWTPSSPGAPNYAAGPPPRPPALISPDLLPADVAALPVRQRAMAAGQALWVQRAQALLAAGGRAAAEEVAGLAAQGEQFLWGGGWGGGGTCGEVCGGGGVG